MKKEKLIKKIREIWKKQEFLEKKIHEQTLKIIIDFAEEDLKDILEDEEIDLALREDAFIDNASKLKKKGENKK